MIEDNPADANLVEEALAEEKLDCLLSIVRDGLHAIQFIEQLEDDSRQPLPDVVLLDLNLPKVSGVEVLKRVRSSPKCGSTKVLIISSSDAPRDQEMVMKLGATEYFSKPSSLAAFMELGPRVRTLLEQ